MAGVEGVVEGAGGGGEDTVAVSTDDTTPSQLENKLVAGADVTLVVLNPGGDEQIQISSTVGSGAQQITRVSANYNQLANDDIIIGTGTFNITLIDVSTAVKQIIIRSNGAGTLTLIPDGGDTVEVTTVLSDTAVTLVPNLTGWLSV